MQLYNQNTSFHLRTPKTHYRTRNGPPLSHIVRQGSPVHDISVRSTLISISDIQPGLPTGLSILRFPTKNLYIFLVFPVRATSATNPSIPHLISLIIYAKNKTYEAPHDDIFPIVLDLHLLRPNILGSLSLCPLDLRSSTREE